MIEKLVVPDYKIDAFKNSLLQNPWLPQGRNPEPSVASKAAI
jgi:hypothetical protein